MDAEKSSSRNRGIVLVRVVVFLGIFTSLLAAANHFISGRVDKAQGWQLVYDGKGRDSIDVLFVGNSYAYSSFNPYIVNRALGVRSVLISSSASNITVTRSHLKEVLAYKKPKLVVLELNVLVDNYDDLMNQKRGLVYGYLDSMRMGADKINLALQLLKPRYLSEALFPVFRSGYLSTALHAKPEAATEEEKLGFVRLTDTFNGKNPEDKGDLYDWPIIPRQQAELRGIIEMCRDSGVDLWLVNKPRLQPRDLKNIHAIAGEYGVRVIDMNAPPDKMDVTTKLYYDGGHLNAIGANRATELIIARLEGYLGKTADYSRVLTMKDEQVEKNGDGSWRFTVDAYAPNATYSFEITRDGKTLCQQQESESNAVVVQPGAKGTYVVKYRINFYDDGGKQVGSFSSEFSYKLKIQA